MALPLPGDGRLELDGPYVLECAGCGLTRQCASVGVTLPARDEQPDAITDGALAVCASCLAGALAVRLAAAATLEQGSTDWIADSGLPSDRPASVPTGRQATTERTDT